jgi:hypothetical protein
MPNTMQAMWVSTGNPETVDDVTPYAPGMLGAELTVKAPGPAGTPSSDQYVLKTYKYVKGDPAMVTAPAQGAPMFWFDEANNVVTTAVTLRGRYAGIFKNVTALGGAGRYFFIQTKGLSLVKILDTPTSAPTTAGLMVVPSATVLRADCLAAGSAATYPAIGVSAGTQDGTTKLALVDLGAAA